MIVVFIVLGFLGILVGMVWEGDYFVNVKVVNVL